MTPLPALSSPRLALDLAARLATSTRGVFTRSIEADADEEGRFFREVVRLPAWRRCVYYAPFQRHAIDPTLDLWPEGYNQCHPLPLTRLEHAKRGGLFAVFELESGAYLALLPLVGERSAAWLRGDPQGLRLEAGHFGRETFRGEAPLLAYALDADLYAACAQAWAVAFAHPALAGVGRLRHEKTFPEVFEHLGWCSFEEFKLAIDEKVICSALQRLAASPVPVRWALIDDGHVDDGTRAGARLLQTQEGAMDGLAANRLLHGVGPHPEKFPRGWSPVRAAADADPRLKWLGLWLNFNGYWGGIAPDHALGRDVDRHLVSLEDSPDAPKLPGEEPGDGDVFYRAFTDPVAAAGFDFIKVDNQAANLRRYALSPQIGNGVAAAVGCRKGLESAVERHFQGIIGCMAHNNLCAFHQPVSQVMRCSEDYKKEDRWRAKHHLHNSFGNMLWLGQTVWGDHDMFHSSDHVAGPLMARSKAISGGPIYLSDHPDDFVQELIAPLHLSDGRILRPLAPAVPLPESIFINPYEDDQAYRVIAPLPHGCAALAAYNLTHPEKIVHGAWRASDLQHRSALLSPPPSDESAVPPAVAGTVLLYDCLTREARPLEAASAEVAFALKPLTDAFVILSPIVRGWALIGHPDKYLPPAFVTRFEISADGSSVKLAAAEAGTVLLWHADQLVSLSVPADGQPVVFPSPSTPASPCSPPPARPAPKASR